MRPERFQTLTVDLPAQDPAVEAAAPPRDAGDTQGGVTDGWPITAARHILGEA